MNKVISFAKLSGIIFPIIMILQIAAAGFKVNNVIIGVIVNVLMSAVWITFFALLINACAKRSPVVTPCWIAIAAVSIDFISGLINSYASYQIIQEDYDWSIISPLFTVSGAMFFVYSLAFAVAFIWLSRYFKKGSTLKAMSIIIAIVAIALPIINMTVKPWNISDESTRNIAVLALAIFRYLIIYLPPTIFFLAFSKLKKS